MRKTLEDRFWEKVDRSGGPDRCWRWLGSNDGCDGYGRVWLDGRFVGAHRIAWLLKNGPIPPDLVVRHRCDQPDCCRPDHLELGSHLDNMQDMVTRGRSARGETSGRATITEAQALRIRELRLRGMAISDIAKAVGTEAQTVSAVISGRSWRHLGPPVRMPRRKRCSRRLTASDLEQIRALRAEGLPLKEIASRFGISITYASQLLLGKRSPHFPVLASERAA